MRGNNICSAGTFYSAIEATSCVIGVTSTTIDMVHSCTVCKENILNTIMTRKLTLSVGMVHYYTV